MTFYYRGNGESNEELIAELNDYGIIHSIPVYEAMKKTDRGFYVKDLEEAYKDKPQPIGHDVTISAPHIHAYALELLQCQIKKPGAKILDIGSGSGYLTACFARMADSNSTIIGIDVIKPIIEWSILNLNKDDPELIQSGRVKIKYGDGWKGDLDNAPFDAIHVGASAEVLPQDLVKQLKLGGRMIIPVGTWDQKLVVVDRLNNGAINVEEVMGVQYVKLIRQS